MKKLLLSVVLALYVTPVLSQNANCGSTTGVIEFITDKFEEELVWSNESNGYTYMIFENDEFDTWTALEIKGDVACVVVSGGNPNPPDEKS